VCPHVAAEAEGVRGISHGLNAERNVLVERHAQFFGALQNIFAADSTGEGFVLHALLYGADFQVKNAF